MTSPLLYSYFEKSASVLLAEYQRSKIQKVPVILGKNRELFCEKFLANVLPDRLKMRNGEIWDYKGNRTGQIDLLITKNDIPRLNIGDANIYFVESILGVIEVKSNLNRDKLQEAIQNLSKVKQLNPLGGFNVLIKGYPVINRPLRCIFSYEGATWKTLVDELLKPNAINTIDIISILNRGILISSELNALQWEGFLTYFNVSGISFIYLNFFKMKYKS